MSGFKNLFIFLLSQTKCGFLKKYNSSVASPSSWEAKALSLLWYQLNVWNIFDCSDPNPKMNSWWSVKSSQIDLFSFLRNNKMFFYVLLWFCPKFSLDFFVSNGKQTKNRQQTNKKPNLPKIKRKLKKNRKRKKKNKKK